MRGLTRASVIACMVTACGVVAQSLSSASYLPTVDQVFALLIAFLFALASALLLGVDSLQKKFCAVRFSAFLA